PPLHSAVPRMISASLRISEESSEESTEESKNNTPSESKSTPFCIAKMAGEGDWRGLYSEGGGFVIDFFHEIFGPDGWRPINQDSKELHKALAIYTDDDEDTLREKFHDAVRKRKEGYARYNAPMGNKLIRILWNI